MKAPRPKSTHLDFESKGNETLRRVGFQGNLLFVIVLVISHLLNFTCKERYSVSGAKTVVAKYLSGTVPRKLVGQFVCATQVRILEIALAGRSGYLKELGMSTAHDL